MTGTRKRAENWRGRPLSDLERRELALEAAQFERRQGDELARRKPEAAKEVPPVATPATPEPQEADL